ncbi:MAG: YbaB/EbfC family nucleoid-associated protein [Gemmatimonadales bacterium]|nr:MAG: YbaB/EbfC family nucleoid-associated protein [Gemmatimonadales bacterium]
MDLKNLQQIMQMSTQLQSRMKDMQETLVQQRYAVSSGAGLVEATVDGKGTVVAVRIDPKAVDPADVEMLEDLVLAAVTQAQKRANQAMEAEMKRATGGLSLPGLGSLLGS